MGTGEQLRHGGVLGHGYEGTIEVVLESGKGFAAALVHNQTSLLELAERCDDLLFVAVVKHRIHRGVGCNGARGTSRLMTPPMALGCSTTTRSRSAEICVGASPRDIRLSAPLRTDAGFKRHRRVAHDTQPAYLLDNPIARQALVAFMQNQAGLRRRRPSARWNIAATRSLASSRRSTAASA